MAKGKVKSWLFIVLAVVIVVGGICAYFFYLKPRLGTSSTPATKPQAPKIYLAESLPPKFTQAAKAVAKDLKWDTTTDPDKASVKVDSIKTDVENSVAYYQVWVLTRPFSTLASSDFSKINTASDLVDMSPDFTFPKPYTKDDTAKSGAALKTIQELDGTQLVQKLSGRSYSDKRWWADASYPLISAIYISGEATNTEKFTSSVESTGFWEANNYLSQLPQATDFVKFIKTGTSVIGGPGWQTCQRRGGFTYPIAKVKDYLLTGDHVIISNESSFADNCYQAPGTTAFCGSHKQLQNLLSIKGDIISLTGNHMCDYGRAAFANTLDIYKKNKLLYYAAGKNITEAYTPLYLETPSGKIAFLGVNNMGPGGVVATATATGTTFYNSVKFKAAIKTAKENADYVWVDTQLWPEFGTTPTGDQLTINREAVNAGADIVTGVSSHELQGMTFYKGKPIFYGMGNFLFDQMWSLESRQGIVIEAIFYNKRIASMEVLPTMTYDYCQPRFMTGSEKTRILKYFVGISKL